MGDRVKVKIIAANLEKRQIDMSFVPEEKEAKKRKNKTSSFF
jgi:hypothetical protein